MPTPELPARSGVDLGGVANLANLFLGKTTNQSSSGTTTSQNSGAVTTTGSRTTTESVPQSAIDATVKSILEGTQGLASVAAGENKVGLYNSSTNRMLINDLIARAAAEGAKLQKSTTTTVNETAADTRGTTTTKNDTVNTKTEPPISNRAALGGVGGLSLLSVLGNTDPGKQLINSIASKFGLGKAAKDVTTAVAGTKAAEAGGSDGPTEEDVKEAMARNGENPNSDNSFTSSPTNTGTGTQAVTISPRPVAGVNPTESQQQFSAPIFRQPQIETVSPGFDDTTISPDLSTNLDFNLGTGNEFDFSQVGNVDQAAADSIFGNAVTPPITDTGIDPDLGGADFGDFINGGDFNDAGVIEDLSGGGFGDVGDTNFFDQDFFDFAIGGHVTPQGNANLIAKHMKPGYAEGGEVNTHSYGTDKRENYVTKTIDQEDLARRNYNNDQNNQAKLQILRDAYERTVRALNQPEAGAGRGSQGKPGYAGGGLVDLTNTGLRVQDRKVKSGTESGGSGQTVGAIQRPTQASPVTGNTQSVSNPRAVNIKPAAELRPTASSNSGPQNVQTIRQPQAKPNFFDTEPGIGGESSVGSGTTNGQVGTPSENAAAIGGFATGAIGAIAGPVAGLAATIGMNALGMPNQSLSPFAHLGKAAFNLATLGNVSIDAALNAITDNAMATLGLANPNDPSNIASLSDQDSAFANVSLDGLDSSSSIGGGDAAGEGGGVGGSGASAGDAGAGDGGTGSSGDGSGSDGGSASAATGKYIQGPGTETSDSIDAKLSNGEFVLNAEAVKAVGLDTLNWVNDTFKPSPSKLAQGKKLRIAQESRGQ